jgi:excisionase family DNA binding protein
MTNEAWLTVEQVAAHLNIATVTIYRWIEAGKIPCHKVGRQWRFKISEVDEWIRTGGAADKKHHSSKGNEDDI